MKRAILVLLVLFFVAAGAFAADVSVGGKLEVRAEISPGGTSAPFTSTGEVDTDLKISVDDYSSATVKLRATTEGIQVQGGALRFDEVFLESDVAGALGWTEATGGLALKFKSGYFHPGPTERGEIKTIVEQIKTIDGDPLVSGPAGLLTVGWTDAISVAAGVRFPTSNDRVITTTFDNSGNETTTTDEHALTAAVWSIGAYGDVTLGPGSLGYAAHFLDYQTAARQELGVGVQYKDIALGPVVLGVGAQFAFNLEAPAGTNNIGVGASLGAGFLDDVVELDIDYDGKFGGDSAKALNRLGAGFQLQNPDKTLGLTVRYELDGTGDTQVHQLDPSLWTKVGATTFTVGLDANDLDNFNTASKIYLTAKLGY